MEGLTFLDRLTPPPRAQLLASRRRLFFWNLWFAWQARKNMVRAFHPEQPGVPFSWGNVFGRKLFILCDPDLIHQVLVTHHKKYIKGQLFDRLFRPAVGESVFTAEGESWTYRRKMIAPAFHPRAIKALETRMRTQIDQAMANLGDEMDAGTWAPELALAIALDGLFSGGAGDRTSYLAHHMKHGVALFGRMSIPDALNLPPWVPRPAKRAALGHARAVDEVVYDLIDQRTAKADVQDQPDLLDLILGSRDEETGQGLSRDHVRNEVFTFFAAGHDTSANAIQWVLYELASRPDLQAEAAEDEALLERIVLETLRLYPTAPQMLREAAAEDRLNDVSVPPGALVVMPIYHFHRSPLYWDRPTEFDPDHFLPEKVAARPRHAYLPFGSGPRVCPGKMMALQEIRLVIGALVRAYEFERLDENKIEPLAQTTLRPSQSMRLRLRPRA